VNTCNNCNNRNVQEFYAYITKMLNKSKIKIKEESNPKYMLKKLLQDIDNLNFIAIRNTETDSYHQQITLL
jgi:hypothetical protein